MWGSFRRFVQCAGLIVVLAFLTNGITCNPIAAADTAGMDEYPPASSSFQPLLSSKESSSSIKASVSENYGKLPLSFEANNGQVDDSVKFLSRGNGYTLYLTGSEAVLSLKRSYEKKDELHALRDEPQIFEAEQVENEVIRLKNIGTNPDPLISGLKELPGKSNYFIGSDPAKWRTNLSNYEKVKVQEVYPGIDLVYYGNQRQLEYDWIVAPGADPNAIRFVVESKSDPRIDSSGSLLLDDRGKVRLNKPLIYQERNGDRIEIAGKYQVQNNRQVEIEIGKYDTALPLVIDPVLVYSTYVGNSGSEYAYGIAVDASGNAYLTGGTESAAYPTMTPYQGSNNGDFDVFVTKMNAAGNALVYSTYIGGFDSDVAYGIALDASNNAYIVGTTESPNYPTENQYETSDGYRDAFVTKLNASGDALIYSTYLGGDEHDHGYGIAVDASNNAYVTGYTDSPNFPIQNPYQANRAGELDVFVTKLSTAGNALVYSTYLGGAGEDYSNAIAIDASGNAYVSGPTYSADFPTQNPFQANLSGGADVYVTKLNASGSALVYSTYLGGSDNDYGYTLAVDSSGHAYAAGGTYSPDFPTENPFQADFGGSGNCDGFISKLNPAGDALIYSTYLGGSG